MTGVIVTAVTQLMVSEIKITVKSDRQNSPVLSGQLCLVGLALPLLAGLRRIPAPVIVAELPATAIGALGFYWVLTRTVSWLAG